VCNSQCALRFTRFFNNLIVCAGPDTSGAVRNAVQLHFQRSARIFDLDMGSTIAGRRKDILGEASRRFIVMKGLLDQIWKWRMAGGRQVIVLESSTSSFLFLSELLHYVKFEYTLLYVFVDEVSN
jgi:hypothetical protein